MIFLSTFGKVIICLTLLLFQYLIISVILHMVDSMATVLLLFRLYIFMVVQQVLPKHFTSIWVLILFLMPKPLLLLNCSISNGVSFALWDVHREPILVLAHVLTALSTVFRVKMTLIVLSVIQLMVSMPAAHMWVLPFTNRWVLGVLKQYMLYIMCQPELHIEWKSLPIMWKFDVSLATCV